MQPFFIVGIALTAVAAWVDFRTGEIPNWFTFAIIAGSPFAHLFYTLAHTGHRGEAGLAAALSVGGALLAALLPVGLWYMDPFGDGETKPLRGGDVKLFIGLGGLLAPPLAGLEAQLWSFCATALIAPVGLAWEGKLFRTVGNAAQILVNPFLPKARRRAIDRASVSWFRMGPAIFLGTAWTAYLHLGQ